MSPDAPREREPWATPALVLAALVLFSLALRLPALFQPHVENDEVIYQTLADKVSADPLDYSLRGTEILARLPREIYDTPLYERPPLFVFLLALFRGVMGAACGILLPILAGALTLVAAYGVAKELYGEEVALRAGLLLACCPLLLFSSVRILIDALLVLLATSTVWLCLVALRKRSHALFAATGVLLGLTVLTKETGVLTSLVCAVVLFREGPRRDKLWFLLPLTLSAAAVTLPWFLYVHHVLGSFVVWRASISPEYMERYPFIRWVATRPWHFYVSYLTLCAPAYLFSWIGGLADLRKRHLSVESVWAALFLLALTLIGLRGGGYQTRYVLPAMPALAILGARVLGHRSRWLWSAALVLLSLGLFTGLMNSLVSRPADLLPLPFFLSPPENSRAGG